MEHLIEDSTIIEGSVGKGTTVWHNAHIRGIVGDNCVIGRGVYIDADVTIGNFCKIQNYACIYGPSTIGDAVFVGPMVMVLNDKYPRATSETTGRLLQQGEWHRVGAEIASGVSIGAGAIIMPGITIHCESLIGAGAIITRDVLPRTRVFGAPGYESRRL